MASSTASENKTKSILLRSLLASFSEVCLDLLFPQQCIGCRKDGEILCVSCLCLIPLLPEQHCPVCKERITPNGQTCFTCRPNTALDGLFVATHYRHLLLKRAIHAYKYRFIEDLRFPLGKLLTDALRSTDLALPDVILPVPLHKRRLRWRGFNQSEHLAHLLGQELAPHLPIPVLADHLIRHRYTSPQMSIGQGDLRKSNVHDAFSWQPPANKEALLKDKTVWLIDDVATTTATLESCARVLKQEAHVRNVFGIVLAR